MRAALLTLLLLGATAAGAAIARLGDAPVLDLRVEVGPVAYLVRIGRADLDRLAYAQALGEPTLPGGHAMAVLEDAYPPRVLRALPPELARRVAGLWLLVRERGWTGSAGIEWDPSLGSAGFVEPSSDLKDAPAASRGSRMGVWSAQAADPLRESRRFSVRCVEGRISSSRCFRVWHDKAPRP